MGVETATNLTGHKNDGQSEQSVIMAVGFHPMIRNAKDLTPDQTFSTTSL
jgi:hypothetical protein